MEKLMVILKEAGMDHPKLIGLAVRQLASDLLNNEVEIEMLKEDGFQLEEEKLEKLIDKLDELSWEL